MNPSSREYRNAAKMAWKLDVLLEAMNLERPNGEFLMGFDLDYLAVQFKKHADWLEEQ